MHKPILSIVVLVYNSSKYLNDALASILSQDYYNIDLVISDDCSTDNSLEMVKDWAKLNNNRLYSITVVESAVNTGVSANCNRGAKKARGEWLKFLAADDMLLPNYTHDCLEFISRTDAVAFHTGVNFYSETFLPGNRIKEYNPISHTLNCGQITAYQQYRLLLRDNRIIPTTFLLTRDVFFSVGGCDEDIPYIDDWPLFIKLTKAGFKIYYLDKVTANYRVRKNSIYDQSAYQRSIARYGVSERMVMKKYVVGDIPVLEKVLYAYEFARIKLVMNSATVNQVYLSRITYYVTTPIWWAYRRVYVRLFYFFNKYTCLQND